MASRSLLIFDLDGARFGLDAVRVRESLWLPELTPVEEAPPWVAGLFSLRGQIMPVTDLRLRFGHPARRYRPSDQVVVLELDHLLMGLIVSEVLDVIEVSADAIQPPPQFDLEARGHVHLVAGEARVGDGLVAVLDIGRLTHLPRLPDVPAPPALKKHAGPPQVFLGPLRGGRSTRPKAEGQPKADPAKRDAALPHKAASSGWAYFCPEATPEERALYHERAKALMEAAVEEEGARIGLAVVEIDGECFGVELAAVQEFCDVARLSPIPCCPPHILGAMSLRGDLVTLIDPRAALDLPTASRGGKAVIGSIGDQAVGIAVDEVHDVVYLRQEALQPPPAALCERHGVEIRGAVPYAGRMMAVLDLSALLAREEWIVNENVNNNV
ncbi:MAG: chemotaxis protein CheW [Rhodocyclaceae bacterium]|nr:chemotaxis protein CheW [Rhodocyclaceae bacterium]